ncbi:hypothetical protein AY599_22120 [Leptolyngbya valderiana BDU 20041]|nr:hypothetical protein AY599_22120 [Leptolyngbya valderiana BDU 20041]
MAKVTTWLRQAFKPIEETLLGDYYFSLQDYLSFADKGRLLQKAFQSRVSSASEAKPEIIVLLYSKAGERLLVPLLANLCRRSPVETGAIAVTVVFLPNVHQLTLTPATQATFEALGITPETDYFPLIRACKHPDNKLVVMCLDHRYLYDFHRCGVDTADRLAKFGVKTLSIQHGGTRSDCVRGLATAASDVVLVWGKRVQRELRDKYDVEDSRVRLVGNPLHDRIANLVAENVRATLFRLYPDTQTQLAGKSLVLIATCLHSEYREYDNEPQLYQDYIRELYRNLPFDRAFAIVKMHPLDSQQPNLYREAAEALGVEASVLVIEPEVSELDVYRLLTICDVLVTRCSTVAEEALMMGKKAIAFDLFEEGPSKGYKHLEEYGSYTTAYPETLRSTLETALTTPQPTVEFQQQVVEDLTYALDGRSSDRAVDEILKQLDISNP